MADYILAEVTKLPVMIKDSGELLELPTLWLIERFSIDGKKIGYVQKQGGRLKRWLTFLERRNIELDGASTEDFLAYKKQLQESGLGPNSINLLLSDPIAFYWWAKKEAFLRSSIIGWKSFQRPDLEYQIEVDQPSRNSEAPYKVPFLLGTHSKQRESIPTPEQIKELWMVLAARTKSAKRKDSVSNEAMEVRNGLMLRWFMSGCMRCKEVVSFRTSSLPPRVTGNQRRMVRVYLDDGCKNDKPRYIEVPGSLINDSHDFIEMERDDIVQIHLRGHDPGVLLPSTSPRNGGVMHEDSLGQLVANTGLGIRTHDLRAYGLFKYACNLYAIERMLAASGDKKEVNVHLIKKKLIDQAGHESISTTIRHYVDLAAVVTGDRKEFESLEDEETVLEQRLAMIRSMREKFEVAQAIMES
jgi:site-specific recombinase XerD